MIFSEPVEEAKDREDPGILKGEIRIDALSFRYDSESPFVLDQISLSISHGEFIGITGPSGSGKSTLVRLLLGFEVPTQGSIYYDGKDLACLDVRRLRKQMGIVFQNEGILAGTIYDNLVCGGVCDKKEMEQALLCSGFAEDLKELPMGLRTLLPMGGETLSGGQRQRLLLARALLTSPHLLLFDEATSALDNRTQEAIRSNIDALECTRVVIAHRLSTLRKTDRIYVLDRGKIAQEGTFTELSQQKGLFANLFQRQQML